LNHGPESGSTNSLQQPWVRLPLGPLWAGGPGLSAFSFQLHSGEWVEMRPVSPAEEETRVHVLALLTVQSSLVRHSFQLLTLERSITDRVRKLRRAGRGSSTIRLLESERRRLGRELHTGVGQLLAAIRLQLEVVDSQIPQPPQAARQALDRIATLSADALEQVRAVSRRLHPPEWQRLTLSEALRQLWDLSGVPEKYTARLRVGFIAGEPDLEAKTLLYRASQEALSNLVRHAHATRIEMSLEVRGAELVLTIHDNGVGFDPARLQQSPASVSSGIGLRSIREQAAALGGRFSIESGPIGTTLEVSVPFNPVHA
jgi:signal transduction histidine kinase